MKCIENEGREEEMKRTGGVVERRVAELVLDVPLRVCVLQEVLNVLHAAIFAGSEDGVLVRRHVTDGSADGNE